MHSSFFLPLYQLESVIIILFVGTVFRAVYFCHNMALHWGGGF